MSPTYQEMHKRVRSGVIGDVKLARGLYGWPGPTWAKWFYQVGGGALFDLGVYNITSLCGFLGPVRRVTSLMGAAVPERTINGELIKVEVADVAQVLLDFGNSRFASITTGFTIQKYGRGPGLELYGLDGTMNLLGDDWAPDGFEQWRNEAQQWEIVPEVSPGWQWTSGLTHLVECIEGSISSLTLPEHAFHVLEVMLASERSAQSGNAVDVSSDFPDLDFSNRVPAANNGRAAHDTRITR
ncbi:MAG: Gfo/Idh/MocA family oxidoreductase [Nocardioidaceae bacterium]